MSSSASSSTGIRKLPSVVVNQIAAGEVVERPASAVKELLDNAIDSSASRIMVELESGGVELVRVTDDGVGIAADELEMAVEPHATSKIRETRDLDAIATMGFRGEALASIASVSRLAIRSRTEGQSAASELRIEGGGSPVVGPASGPVGTRVSVRNLFFNIPARRKFLKTAATERGHCVRIARSLAMSHPALGFTVVSGGSVVVDCPPGQSTRARAVSLLGSELEGELLEVGVDRFDDERGLALWGLVGTPTLASPTVAKQHVFLNGRPIRDKAIQHALREAYRGLIEPGRHPLAVLMLQMSPAGVDVNVHPAKAEVRFRDQSMVHQAVYGAVRDALRAADLTPIDRGSGGAWRFATTTGPAISVDRSGNGSGPAVEPSYSVGGERGGVSFLARRKPEEQAVPSDRDPGPDARASRVRDAPGQASIPSGSPAPRALQIHNSFVVTQDEQGLVIIDQHALHERVMFERLKRRLDERGELESQRFLLPEVVSVSEAQSAALRDSIGALRALGVEAEDAGPGAVALTAYPTFLIEKGVPPSNFIGDLLDKAADEGFAAGNEEALHEVLDMMACKAAVKAGDRMSDAELNELLLMREEIERSSSCPHGRPTSVRLTVRELERQFGR